MGVVNHAGPVAAEQWHLYLIVGAVLVFVAGPVLILTPLIAWHYRLSNKHNVYRPNWDFSWPLEILIWTLPIRIASYFPSIGAVVNVGASGRFFADARLTEGEVTLNERSAQVTLDGLDHVRVEFVPMRPASKPPHLELLRYRIPRGRPHPPLAPHDFAATRIVWHAGHDALVRVPDGHRHQLTR